MKILVLLLLLCSCIGAFAGDQPRVDPKVNQILTAVIRDVLFGDDNKTARAFYGTKGDMTVILLNGSGLDSKPVTWPAGFKPEIEGFTILMGRQDGVTGDEKHDRRLAIRLDRFSVDKPEVNSDREHEFWDRSPIRISIQNGGGSKNGSVIGGLTTWYSPVREDNDWSVMFEGAID